MNFLKGKKRLATQGESRVQWERDKGTSGGHNEFFEDYSREMSGNF